VLANARVLLVLMTTQPRHAGDGAAESMLIVTHLGAATGHHGSAVN
jgi:hypothetical protein